MEKKNYIANELERTAKKIEQEYAKLQAREEALNKFTEEVYGKN